MVISPSISTPRQVCQRRCAESGLATVKPKRLFICESRKGLNKYAVGKHLRKFHTFKKTVINILIAIDFYKNFEQELMYEQVAYASKKKTHGKSFTRNPKMSSTLLFLQQQKEGHLIVNLCIEQSIPIYDVGLVFDRLNIIY